MSMIGARQTNQPVK